MHWSVQSLILAVTVVSSCKQYRAVPVREATPKLSSENVTPSGAVVVTDIEGQQVHIERFRFVDIHVTDCPSAPEQNEICLAKSARFAAPLRLELDDRALWVTPSQKDRRRDGRLRFENVRHVTVVNPSAGRTWVVVGTAVTAGILAAIGTRFVLGEVLPDD